MNFNLKKKLKNVKVYFGFHIMIHSAYNNKI